MATRNGILLNLERDIAKLESLLEDYQIVKEDMAERWEAEKPLFVKDVQQTFTARERQIMEDLSSLYIEKEKLTKNEQEHERDR